MESIRLGIVLVLLLSIAAIAKHRWAKSQTPPITGVRSEKSGAHNAYTNITPLTNLNWENEEPLSLRPFKPMYHLTMALENISVDNLIEMDNTYLSRIHLRRQIIADHPTTLAFRPGSEAAIHEFYTWLTQYYLPQRFPTMYTSVTADKPSSLLKNKVTGETIPIVPKDAQSALRELGSHVDTDFLFLLPSSPEDGKYHLEAFVTCFPSGFSTFEKLGLPLAAIHKPVPGYAEKLEKSMDRFFAKLPTGKIVKRANWSVTTNDVLYAEGGTHLYAAEEDDYERGEGESRSGLGLEEMIERQRRDVRVEDCRLRCERQTLHRLPETGALVFAFKTYLYTLADVKAEGSGEDLANAIDGLAKGSVPDMHFYKRGVVWGEKVKAFLRS